MDLPCPRLRWFGAAAQHGATAPVGRDGGAMGKNHRGGWILSHEMVDLPMKNGDLPMKNGDLPIKNG